LNGTVASGNAFTIDSASTSTLKFAGAGTSTAAARFGINNASQTLEVASGANLTIGAAESITNGKIVLSGGTLTDGSGLTIGASGTLRGQGTVAANIANV